MRQPTFVRTLILALVLAFIGTAARPAFADDRTEARTHYQAGVKFYAGGDYRSAIREFSAAQQLAPADLNNYNLALCYDKLGDAEPAIQYYRAYLDKQPNTDKRAEIDASVQRLDAAAKSVAAKKADEARKVNDAKQAEDARIAADAAKKAAAQKAADDARLAAEAKKRPPEEQDPMMPHDGVGGGGSTGTPSTGLVSTGDQQLDRVQGINIDQVRDQRVGGSASGIPANDPRNPGAVAQNGNQPPPNGANGYPPNTAGAPNGNGYPPNTAAAGAPNAQNPNGTPMNGEPPKKATPIYKKWWFWAVVAVSAYVVYQIATDDSHPSNSARMVLPEVGGAAGANQGGMTLMHF